MLVNSLRNTDGCPPAEELVLWGTPGLPEPQRAKLEDHLSRCTACNLALGELAQRSSGPIVSRSEWSVLAPPSAGALPSPGEKAGRFILLEWAGQGGMGRVCAAYDPALHRKVALKFLLPRRIESWSASAREQLEQEAQALARVAHPNVVSMFDIDAHSQIPFLAMEFVDGVNLRQWLESQTRSTEEVLELFLQAAQGLLAVHRANVLHRDFKPENVLVGKDGRVRLSDFGLASEGGSREAHPPGGPDALLGSEALSSGTFGFGR